jgi:multimeric flavodoxin WrbA
MKAIAINGSPRKKWNTAQLLQAGLDGAADAGAKTELVHLYDLRYTGCVSCFACKKLGGASYGRCAVQDELNPLLERVLDADVILLGTPVYFWSESGMLRCLLERLLFPLYTYTPERTSLYAGQGRVGLIYTMNLSEEDALDMGLFPHLRKTREFIHHVFGNLETLFVPDTLQFDDYSKYLCTRFDPEGTKAHHDAQFPQDLAEARALGLRLAEKRC